MNKLSKTLLTGILTLCTVANVYADTARVYCAKSDGSHWYWSNLLALGQWIENTLPNGSSVRYFYIVEPFYQQIASHCPQDYYAQPDDRESDAWRLFKVYTLDGDEYFAPGSLGPVTNTGQSQEISIGSEFLSDIRLKQGIQPLQHNLDKISRLNGYSYSWRPDSIQSHLAGQTEYGVIAQEIQAEFPHLVKQDVQGYLRVDYRGLIPVLLESIKALKIKVERLESQH
ncbi:tail fiber domain-containing protein [Spartinivicinus poritis]|uniref:Tail fiber domain-containing protein n=1 Tax=Spartinivicinus poritis TaxID=2994640 RepID=A0ABT5UI42_9GAMM|nr:tail fiber domain-containing protein [Spartinivicinus sp. A2-2]MDE1465103.1 tail fiber domain-containing protein [Spartinivicinus sp. A2-2]